MVHPTQAICHHDSQAIDARKALMAYEGVHRWLGAI
jgi:hypothetical protein